MNVTWRSINKPISLGIIVLLLMMTRLLIFYFGPEERLIGIIPDDAFYYIQLAKHRVVDGFWTFDGTSKATGFHLLYGYLLTAIFTLLPNIEWQKLYLLIGTISVISLSVSAIFSTKMIGQLFDKEVQFMGVIPFITIPIFSQSTSLMESWAVVLFSTLSIYVVIRKSSTMGWTWFLVIFLIGLLGSLARTDFGLITGLLFTTSLLFTGFKRQEITLRAFLLLAGAIIGLAIALLHNQVVSGNFLQASAQIKLHWSSILGHSIVPPFGLMIKSITHIIPGIGLFLFLMLIASILFVTSIIRAAKLNYGGYKSERFIVFLACSLTLIGYIFIYRNNSAALQYWYAANFAAPLGVVLAGLTFYALNKARFLVSSVVVIAYFLASPFALWHIPYPFNSAMMKAGIYLRDMRDDRIYSAWNAGIISFFSGKPLVNLDGLTNDDAVPYILSNRLFDYVLDQKIDFIVDYPVMFNEAHRRRGGYDDVRIDNCVRLDHIIGSSSEQWGSSRLSLYSVETPCK